jgi:predicted RNase H-like HicB family nuclease
MPNYIAVIHKDENSSFGVSFPDFPGCISGGDTLDVAKDMAHEALPFHIEGMFEDGEVMPQPSSLESILADPDYSDAAASFVINLPAQNPVKKRVNIMLPENILARIDKSAKNMHMSRSAFLVYAAQHVMESNVEH